ncbi:hypothetical protein [Campylobacter sp. FU_497]|uniref:hypothetical protein n=1 Tax=Campylobacter sp. FU_497 TaxID=2911610 RepID=UPI0021E68E3A|nr:hypothetical protein [Campylobacter sp. FU_497]MCV3463643.1 hypothetical protein [Campylobacter sp. FU_497]
MADLNIIKNKYKNYMDSLKNTSFDKENHEYLCYKENEVINFEKLSEELNRINKFKGKKTVDALILNYHDVYFIEFKNQKQKDIDKLEIIQKFTDSLKLFKKLCEENNIPLKRCTIFLYCIMKDSKKYIYKRRQIGFEIEHAVKSDDYLSKFKVKCAPKECFLLIYEQIFNEIC